MHAARNVDTVANSGRWREHAARKFSFYNAKPMSVQVIGSSVAVHAAIHCAAEVSVFDQHVGSHAMLNLISPLDPQRHFWKTGEWRGEKPLGEISFLPPGATYSSRTVPCESRVTTLSLSADLLDRAREDIGCARNLRPSASMHSPHIRALMELVGREIRNPGMGGDVYMSSLLTATAIALTRHFVGGEDDRQDHWSDEARARRAIEFIAEHLDQRLSIDMIAKECGMSARHLSRVFRASTGMSIWHYVSARRIDIAKALLGRPNARVKDVSRRCGFESPSTFATAFRNASGMTPTQFLKQESASFARVPAKTDRGIVKQDIHGDAD